MKRNFVEEFVQNSLNRSNLSLPSQQETHDRFQAMIAPHAYFLLHEESKSKRSLMEIAFKEPNIKPTFQLDAAELARVLILKPIQRLDPMTVQIPTPQAIDSDPRKSTMTGTTTTATTVTNAKNRRKTTGGISTSTATVRPASLTPTKATMAPVPEDDTKLVFSIPAPSLTITIPPPPQQQQHATTTTTATVAQPTLVFSHHPEHVIKPEENKAKKSRPSIGTASQVSKPTVAATAQPIRPLPTATATATTTATGGMTMSKVQDIFNYFWNMELDDTIVNGAFFGRITELNFLDFGLKREPTRDFINLVNIKDKMDRKLYGNHNTEEFVRDMLLLFVKVRELYADNQKVLQQSNQFESIFREKLKQ